jgi:hypothetical protein
MTKKAGLIGWVLLGVLVMFAFVFYGIIGNAQAQKEGVECQKSFGVLCFSWESNETYAETFTLLGDDSDVSIVPLNEG